MGIVEDNVGHTVHINSLNVSKLYSGALGSSSVLGSVFTRCSPGGTR